MSRPAFFLLVLGSACTTAAVEPRPRAIDPLAAEREAAATDPARLPHESDEGLALGAARFSAEGAAIPAGGGTVHIALAAFGRGGALTPATDAAPTAAGPEVRIARGPGVTEWWRSLPSGLEQGVTIDERPAGAGPLVLEMSIGAGVVPETLSDDAIALRDRTTGASLGSYAGLVVVDADGTAVTARMAATGGHIRIEIDDAGARYPIVVDPIVAVEEATLVSATPGNDDYFGSSISISGDGTRVLVGVPDAATARGFQAGQVRVFLRTGTTWALEAVLEAAMDGVPLNGLERFGHGVTLSGDATRAAIALSPNSSDTRVQVFVRSGTTWSYEARINPPSGFGSFGRSLATDRNGTRLLVGYPDFTGVDTEEGGAFGYSRVGTTWSQTFGLLPTACAAGDRCGERVALSADGTRALAGLRNAAVVFPTATSVEEARLSPFFEAGLALNADGTRAVVGNRTEIVSGRTQGAARVFARSGTAWSLEGTLQSPVAVNSGNFGWSAAISADGTRVVLGSPSEDAGAPGIDAGAATAFVRTGTVWDAGSRFYASDADRYMRFGHAVALSDDGSRVAVGANGDWLSPSPIYAGSVRILRLPATNGTACTAATQCSSGSCVDGVCCATTCGAGAMDCQACSIAGGGTVDGTCTALSAAVAPTRTCRAGAGVCDVAEVCSASSTSCPTDVFVASTTECRASAGMCDPAERCTGSAAACPADARTPAATTCRASAGGCDPAELCDGTSVGCPMDSLASMGTECRAALGMCDLREVCAGGTAMCPPDLLAISGSMCRSAAGACDLNDTCNGSSVACADTFRSAGFVCNPAAGACDVDDRCTGGSPDCPVVFASASTVCRGAVGTCDVEERCPGTSTECPTDAFAPPSTLCGAPPSAICDASDHCAGISAACVPEFQPPTVTCRFSSGACDSVETCSGASADCPLDVLLPSGTGCGGSGTGSCSTAGTCNGTSASCPGATLFIAGTPCGAADLTNPCDVQDVCNGISDACPQLWALATVECAPSSGDVCDAPDHCTGTSGDCMPEFLEDVLCRPPAGSCDVAEQCSGDSAACPMDSFLAAGISCRPSSEACDPAEVCDGASAPCPADVVCATDAGATDGGAFADAGAATDVGATLDAGAPAVAATGCACRVGSSARGGLVASAAALLAVVAALARRRVRR